MRPLRKLTITARDIARGARPPQIRTVAGGLEVVQMTDALGTMLDRLNEANRQLVQASRHAGMAEVATGVLHNVGNILTSVNVAIELVNERVGALPIDRVRAPASCSAGARGWRSSSPRSSTPASATSPRSPTRLDADRTAVLADMTTLRGHVDHVNRVVSMQNAYARVGGVTEPTRVSTLIDEAVALGCPDPERHGVAITKRVGDEDGVQLDRHRVLQILVNLIANARDSIAGHDGSATDDGDRGVDRRSIVGSRSASPIAAAGSRRRQLLRIFSAGFTTKPKGHGYGLHSSALAAEQLGGTLRCASAGLGQGACFVLRVTDLEGPSSCPELARILIVDDNEAIHHDFRRILDRRVAALVLARRSRAHARRCTGVGAGGRADQLRPEVRRFRATRPCARSTMRGVDGRPYAVAFVDIRMPPGIDGIETIARMWESQPELEIVLCSAYSDYSWDDIVKPAATPATGSSCCASRSIRSKSASSPHA